MSQVAEFLQRWHKQPKSSNTYSQQPLTSPKALHFQRITAGVELVLNSSMEAKEQEGENIRRGLKVVNGNRGFYLEVCAMGKWDALH